MRTNNKIAPGRNLRELATALCVDDSAGAGDGRRRCIEQLALRVSRGARQRERRRRAARQRSSRTGDQRARCDCTWCFGAAGGIAEFNLETVR